MTISTCPTDIWLNLYLFLGPVLFSTFQHLFRYFSGTFEKCVDILAKNILTNDKNRNFKTEITSFDYGFRDMWTRLLGGRCRSGG
jgi:hypothetical protein